MTRLRINHVTTYEYPRPVGFGEHRLLFRPRDSHDIRLVSTRLTITPTARLRWLHDVFGNSIAVASFTGESALLRFESDIVIQHYGVNDPSFPIEDYARTLPFSYPASEQPDLSALVARHDPDPDGVTDAWARKFLAQAGASDTMDTLVRMTRAIRDDFTYAAREEEGVQSSVETIRLGSGSCRDFALLMMEAARALGLAARFVTGYLYDPALDTGVDSGTVGAGATHAWCQIYLPGMGWTEFDPTNGSYCGTNLIRIGVARRPEQAKPVQGTFIGDPGGPPTMTVQVKVTREAEPAATAAAS